MIGGIDYELVAPSGVDVSEKIVEACRRRWPHGVFLDAEETELVGLASPDLARRLASQEFFVSSDRATAEAWDELGPCEDNWNRMFHFIVDRQTGSNGPYTRVTVVVDEVTDDIQAFLDDVQKSFNEANGSRPVAV